MKILITGHTGYIGRSLIAHLTGVCAHTFVGVSRKPPSTPNPTVDSVTSDELNPAVESFTWDELDSVEGIDCIIHLAGIARETPGKANNKGQIADSDIITHDNDYFQANTLLTQRIYDFFLQSGAHTFIYFSSIKAVAEESGTLLTETAIAAPSTIYGKSKRKAEEYILSHMPVDHPLRVEPRLPHFSNGQQLIYILRPCMIYGPHRKGNLLSLYNYFRKGFPWPFGKLSNNRSYLSIRNLNFILEKLIESANSVTCQTSPVTIPSSGIYHLCDDHPLSTIQIIEMISGVLGRKPVTINLPSWFINFIAHSGTMFHLQFNRMTVKKMTGNLVVSNNKIKKALDIGQMPVSAEEGMKETLEAFNHGQCNRKAVT